MQMVCSIQYRVIKENADDAFYELQNPKEQIQAYVFDGKFRVAVSSYYSNLRIYDISSHVCAFLSIHCV